MAWISNQGFPGTDEWRPKGKSSMRMTSDDLPSHVCWTSSSNDQEGSSIYIDGKAVPTKSFTSSVGSIIGKVAEWQVGSGASHRGANSADFEGDIYNIKVWDRSLNAIEVEKEYDTLGRTIMDKLLERRQAAVAGYDASKSSSATTWSDNFGNNDLVAKGSVTPTLVKDGVLSRYVFAGGRSRTFFESLKKTGISGGDTAVSTCAVYRDRGRNSDYMTLLSSWAGAKDEHEMAWLSRQGHPTTDDWVPKPNGKKGRMSLSPTEDHFPSHICWTTSKWSMQQAESVTHIYINGMLAATQEADRDSTPVRAMEGVWRLGHWDGISDDMQFEGDVYNVKIWHRSLSAHEVASEYTSVYGPIMSAWVSALRLPVAEYDASKGVSEKGWADSSPHHNDLVLTGSSPGPVFHPKFGVGSYFSFGVETQGFLESIKKTGVFGSDTSVSVCAVYKDAHHDAGHKTLLSSWAAVDEGQDMAWFAQQGRPGTDDSTSAGRLSMNSTKANLPSHVCWATSKWDLQDRESVTRIYIDGVEVSTQQRRTNKQHSHALEGVWRIGHWGNGQDNDDFEGDLWNIKVWQRCLSPAEVQQEFITVGKPIQAYQGSLHALQQTSKVSKKNLLRASRV